MAVYPDRPLQLEPGCDRCPALVDCRERIVWGAGSRYASIIVIGEAPGYGEPDADHWRGGNWTGIAYTTRHSGRRIRTLFADLGYADEVFFTNAVKCFPADPDDPTTNREPTAAERDRCMAHLDAEFDLIAPTVAVPTGKHATATLLEADGKTLDGFLERVLEPFQCDTFDVAVVPILHPSYQDVWLTRLGYTSETYTAAIGAALAGALAT